MDFCSLTRKELQTLCKKNRIPANITNAAMADALKALQSVEGIEDILVPAEAENPQLVPEKTPAKMVLQSPDVSRTCRRSTRRGPNMLKEDVSKDLVENSEPAKFAASQRKDLKKEAVKDLSDIQAGDKTRIPKRETVTSVLRKVKTQVSEENENENPVEIESGLRTINTRRSTRLMSQKKMSEEIPSSRKSTRRREAVKIGSMGEKQGETFEKPEEGDGAGITGGIVKAVSLSASASETAVDNEEESISKAIKEQSLELQVAPADVVLSQVVGGPANSVLESASEASEFYISGEIPSLNPESVLPAKIIDADDKKTVETEEEEDANMDPEVGSTEELLPEEKSEGATVDALSCQISVETVVLSTTLDVFETSSVLPTTLDVSDETSENAVDSEEESISKAIKEQSLELEVAPADVVLSQVVGGPANSVLESASEASEFYISGEIPSLNPESVLPAKIIDADDKKTVETEEEEDANMDPEVGSTEELLPEEKSEVATVYAMSCQISVETVVLSTTLDVFETSSVLPTTLDVSNETSENAVDSEEESISKAIKEQSLELEVAPADVVLSQVVGGPANSVLESASEASEFYISREIPSLNPESVLPAKIIDDDKKTVEPEEEGDANLYQEVGSTEELLPEEKSEVATVDAMSCQISVETVGFETSSVLPTLDVSDETLAVVLETLPAVQTINASDVTLSEEAEEVVPAHAISCQIDSVTEDSVLQSSSIPLAFDVSSEILTILPETLCAPETADASAVQSVEAEENRDADQEKSSSTMEQFLSDEKSDDSAMQEVSSLEFNQPFTPEILEENEKKVEEDRVRVDSNCIISSTDLMEEDEKLLIASLKQVKLSEYETDAGLNDLDDNAATNLFSGEVSVEILSENDTLAKEGIENQVEVSEFEDPPNPKNKPEFLEDEECHDVPEDLQLKSSPPALEGLPLKNPIAEVSRKIHLTPLKIPADHSLSTLKTISAASEQIFNLCFSNNSLLHGEIVTPKSEGILHRAIVTPKSEGVLSQLGSDNKKLRRLSFRRTTPIRSASARKNPALAEGGDDKENIGRQQNSITRGESGKRAKLGGGFQAKAKSKGELSAQRKLKSMSLRKLKFLLRERIMENSTTTIISKSTTEIVRKSSALKPLNENCLLGASDN